MGSEVGKGGKAQSRFVNSGDGGRFPTGVVILREGMPKGDLWPEELLLGEIVISKELWPLLLGVSSPNKGGFRSACVSFCSSTVFLGHIHGACGSIRGRVGRRTRFEGD